jgi:hypothetical protein
MDGSQVGRVYWEEKDLDRISFYCEKDVLATVQLFLRYRRMPILEEEQVIHVSRNDSSIDYDREIKIRCYAEAGIPEYWIIDLEQRHIEAYRSPGKDYYKIREIVTVQDEIAFHAFALSFAVAELLGNVRKAIITGRLQASTMFVPLFLPWPFCLQIASIQIFARRPSSRKGQNTGGYRAGRYVAGDL